MTVQKNEISIHAAREGGDAQAIKICTLNDISGISDILRLDSDYLPVFYIYILMKDGDSIIKEKREIQNKLDQYKKKQESMKKAKTRLNEIYTDYWDTDIMFASSFGYVCQKVKEAYTR